MPFDSIVFISSYEYMLYRMLGSWFSIRLYLLCEYLAYARAQQHTVRIEKRQHHASEMKLKTNWYSKYLHVMPDGVAFIFAEMASERASMPQKDRELNESVILAVYLQPLQIRSIFLSHCQNYLFTESLWLEFDSFDYFSFLSLRCLEIVFHFVFFIFFFISLLKITSISSVSTLIRSHCFSASQSPCSFSVVFLFGFLFCIFCPF